MRTYFEIKPRMSEYLFACGFVLINVFRRARNLGCEAGGVPRLIACPVRPFGLYYRAGRNGGAIRQITGLAVFGPTLQSKRLRRNTWSSSPQAASQKWPGGCTEKTKAMASIRYSGF